MPQPSQFSQLPAAVLFDYDGVLVSSEPIHLRAWMQLLAELGLPSDQETIAKNVGRTSPEILTLLLDRHKPAWREEKWDPRAFASRKNDLFLSFAEEGLSLFPGAKQGVQWLRSRQIATAVVSNARRRELEHTMNVLGIWDLMDTVISREDVPEFKPSPIPYLTAAALLGKEPRDCIAIEDSPTGLEAALMAGIPAAAVTTSFPASALEAPIPGRPDLRPVWIGPSLQDFFLWLQSKATS